MEASHHNNEPNQANQPGENEKKTSQGDLTKDLDANGRPTRAQRMRDGKKGILFTIHVQYFASSRSNEVKLEVLKNLYWDEVIDFRHNCPTIGFMIGRSPGQWELILPGNIDSVKVERQNNYFD